MLESLNLCSMNRFTVKRKTKNTTPISIRW